MNIQELERRLIEAGCSRSNYSIGYRDSDVFCLMQIDGVWRVFYTERGLDQEPLFESRSEAEACEFFFKYQTERIQHVHIVGQFRSKDKADELDARLKRLGLQTWLNHIPHEHWNVARFRVFVVGMDIFRARLILGAELPLRDYVPEEPAKTTGPNPPPVSPKPTSQPIRRMTMSEDEFITHALAAIEKQDFELIEGLRDQIRPAYVPRLVATWNQSMPWGTKDAYIALLMDQSGDVVRPVMEDALNSPTVESRAYALCILKGDFKIFDSLLTDGWVDQNKVDTAVALYKSEIGR